MTIRYTPWHEYRDALREQIQENGGEAFKETLADIAGGLKKDSWYESSTEEHPEPNRHEPLVEDPQDLEMTNWYDRMEILDEQYQMNCQEQDDE